jgi:TP901 family phage tail tape measure protein
MVDMANREIKFVISAVNKATGEISKFAAEIESLRFSIEELNKISSEKTGLKKIEITVRNLRQFMKGLGSAAQREAKYFQAFEKVAASFDKVAGAVTFAERNLKSYETIIDKVAAVGARIGTHSQKIEAATQAFGALGKQIKAVSNVNTEKLELLVTLFKNMSEAVGKFTLGGITESLTALANSSKGLRDVSIYVYSIAKSLTRPGIIEAANAISKLGTMGGFGPIGPGGAGGPVGPGGTGGAGGAGGAEFPWGTFSKAETGIFKTFEKGFGGLGEEKVDIGIEKAAMKFIDVIRKGNQHIQEYTQRMFEHPSTRVREAVQKIQQTSTGTVGVVSATQLAELVSGKTFGEAKAGEAGFIGMARGTAIHGVTENITKYIEAKETVGNFLKRQGFKDQEWADMIKKEASVAAREFRRLAFEAASAAEMPVGEKTRGKILAAAKTVGKEIMLWGNRKKGLFAQLHKYMVKDLNMSVEQLGKMRVETEKQLEPLTLIKPEITKMGKGGERIVVERAKLGVPTEIKPEAIKLVRDAIIRLRTALGAKTAEFKEIMQLIRRFGLTITGTADLVVDMGKGMGKIIVDLKTGIKTAEKSQYAKTQLGTYALAGYKELGGLAEQFTYLSGKGELERVGRGAPAPLPLAHAIPFRTTKEDMRQLEIEKEKLAFTREYTSILTEQHEEKRRMGKIDQTVIATGKTKIEAERIITEQLREQNKLAGTTVEKRQAAVIPPAGGGVPPAGGSVPPPGGEPPGGEPPEGWRIPPFDPTVVASYQLINRVITEGSAVLSQYSQTLTAAYLKQRILGERVDLTRTMMTEYDRIVNKLSNSLAKYVELQGLSGIREDKQGMAYQETAVQLERLSNLMDKYSGNLREAAKIEESMPSLGRRLQATVESSKEGTVGVRLSEATKDLDPKIWQRTNAVISDLNNTVGKRLRASLEELIVTQEKNEAKVRELTGGYKNFTDGLVNTIRFGQQAKDVFSSEDLEIQKLINDLKKVHPELNVMAKNVVDVTGAVQFLEAAIRKQRLTMLSNIGTEKEINQVLAQLDKRFKDTGASVTSYTQKIGVAALGLDVLTQNQTELNAMMDRTRKALLGQTVEIERLGREEIKNAQAIAVHTKERERLTKIFDILHSKQRIYTEGVLSMQQIQQQQLGKTAEHFRGLIRTTLKGFVDMMKSQTAWIAGYAVMFGTLRGFRSALGSVITVMHEFARAMRTARSETMTTVQILDEYRTKGVRAMIEFGKGSGDIGEVLYQLGSAGLTSSEALAALNSTMRMLIGTEGEVTDTTKMVAAVYNNFKNEIKTTTGLASKFAYINDIVVATFRDHQVEINELREGYKHLMAMGKVANLTFMEMSGILATLNDRLIKSGIAGRSVQTVLSRISRQPVQFAEAFNIRIDPEAPLDFIRILKDVNKQFVSQQMTAEDVGKIFTRLGLRGAKSFTILVQHIDEVVANIEKLRLTSIDAAEEMAEVMLRKPDVAFNRLKETLAALIRLGFGPLVQIAHGAAVVVSQVGLSVSEANKHFRAFGAALISLTGLMVTFGAATAIFSVLSKRLSRDTTDWKTLTDVTSQFARRLSLTRRVVVRLAKALVTLDLAALTTNFNRLGRVILGSAAAFKVLAGIVAIYLAYKLFDYIHTSAEEYVVLTGKIVEATQRSIEEIATIDERIRSYKNMNEEMRETITLLRQQQEIKVQELLADLPGNFKIIEESVGKQVELLATWGKGLEDAKRHSDSLTESLFMLETEAPTAGIAEYEYALKKQAKSIIQQATIIQTAIRSMEAALISEGVAEAAKTIIKNVYLPQYRNLLALLNEATAKAFRDLSKETFEIKAPQVKFRKEYTVGEFEIQRAIKENLSLQSNYIQLLDQREEVEKRIGVLAYIRKEVSDDEISALQSLGATEEKIREVGANILKDKMATLISQKDQTKEQDEAYKLVVKLLDLMIKIGRAEKQRERSVQGIVRGYEDIFRNITRATTDLAKSVLQLGPLQQIFDIDESATRKIEDFTKNLNRYMEGLDPQPADNVSLAMKRLGYTTKEEAATGVNKLIKQFEGMQKIQVDILKDRAMYSYFIGLMKMEDEHKDKMRDMRYQMAEYHSAGQEVANTYYDLNKRTREYVYQLADLNIKLDELNTALILVDESNKYAIDLVNKAIEATKRKIELTKEEADGYEKLKSVLLSIAKIDIEIKIVGLKEQQLMEAYARMIETRMPEAFEVLKQAQLDRQFIEEATFERIAVYYKELGLTAEQIEKMRTAIVRQQLQERRFLELKYLQESMEAQQRYLSQNAELLMRQTDSLNDFWEASKEAMRAGAATFYIEYENVAKAIEDITKTALEGIADAFTETLMLMIQDTDDTSEQIKRIFFSLFNEIASMLIKSGLAKIMGAVLGSVMGGGINPLSFGQPQSVFGYAPGKQKGGMITGGEQGRDSVPIMVMPGEYIIPKDAVDYYGKELLDDIRRKKAQINDYAEFQFGGYVRRGLPGQDLIQMQAKPGEYIVPKDVVAHYGEDLFNRLRRDSIVVKQDVVMADSIDRLANNLNRLQSSELARASETVPENERVAIAEQAIPEIRNILKVQETVPGRDIVKTEEVIPSEAIGSLVKKFGREIKMVQEQVLFDMVQSKEVIGMKEAIPVETVKQIFDNIIPETKKSIRKDDKVSATVLEQFFASANRNLGEFSIGGYQDGGIITGGIPKKDSVPIMVAPGEYVVPADSVDHYGRQLFDMLRKKEVKKMQEGGFIESYDRRTSTTKSATIEDQPKGTYKEGDTNNYITIKTNDVNSFRQALYENRDFLAGLVVEEQREVM